MDGISVVFLCTAMYHVTGMMIDVRPKNVSVLEGDDVTLDCSVVGQKPGELVIWKKISGQDSRVVAWNNRTMDERKYRIEGPYNLIVRDVTVSDDGLYLCDAEANIASASLAVSVPMTALTLTSNTSSAMLPSNTDVRLTCRSWHSHPPADIRWFRGVEALTDVTISTTKTFHSDGFGDCESTITVRMRREDQNVPYRCVADLPASRGIQETFLFQPVATGGVPMVYLCYIMLSCSHVFVWVSV